MPEFCILVFYMVVCFVYLHKMVLNMEVKDLSSRLKKDAIALGLCNQWQQEWKDNEDKQSLIKKYFDGLDFPLKYHWPSNQFIKENFEQNLLRKNNILVDDTRSLLNPTEAVILGNSKATIRVNSQNSSIIYIRDKSCVDIFAKNTAFVIVHVFEDASVKVKTFDTPRVLVLIHSEHTNIEASQGVIIKKELDYLK